MKAMVLLLLLLFSTCNAQKNNSGTTDGKEGQDPDPRLVLIVNDPYSGVEVAETRIVKDAKNLRKFYSQINRTRKPGLPVPDIDFSKEMVVVHCSGATGGGTMPKLYVMEETEFEIVLGIREKNEKSSSSAVTTPFSVYRMPLSKKKVIVRK